MTSAESAQFSMPRIYREEVEEQPKATAPGSSTSSGSSDKTPRSPPILCLGAVRTGSASLSAALRTLGISRVHHGTEICTEAYEWQWRILSRAADATFPNIPSYTGRPFTRAQWDELWGGYDAVTDVASYFAVSLINAYPDAKVILVERDVDRWHESVGAIFEPWERWTYRAAIKVIGPLAGNASGTAASKYIKGWTGSKRHQDVWTDARAAYVRHYRDIRALVPREQLLEYKLTDGWEPLAKFLGKEVPGPDVKFPHLNDAAAHKIHTKKAVNDVLRRFARNMFLPCLFLAFSIWLAYRSHVW
ncbi:hypothetical protein NLG97_g7161 [Lecanicillium saksenae]|uniref:Uncharacterized protein n=1 Tax=Lecanicillium saksenae TaxID=468837 RepID=A0ACC1QMM0_9HYPO|nr:hypothetical protein NLG97_g7161 [Lecanicillium saksenae]